MMVGRMKSHFIDAAPIAVVRLQGRLIYVRVESPLDDLFTSGKGAHLAQTILRPTSSLALNTLNQSGILRKNIVIDQRRWLIKNSMRTELDGRNPVHHIHTISFQPFNVAVCCSCAKRPDEETTSRSTEAFCLNGSSVYLRRSSLVQRLMPARGAALPRNRQAQWLLHCCSFHLRP